MRDNGIVFYSGGFPSRSWRQAYLDVVTQQPTATAFHWGDIDEAGVRIASSVLGIAQQVGLKVAPHQMSRRVAEAQSGSVPRKERPAIQIPALATADLDDLWRWLMSPEGKPLEQESLDPISPIS